MRTKENRKRRKRVIFYETYNHYKGDRHFLIRCFIGIGGNRLRFCKQRGHSTNYECTLDHIGVAEQLDDVVVGDGDAKGAQEHRGALLALTVDGDHELVALVDLKLKPCTAGRDDLGLVDLLARIHLGAVVHTRGADELRDDDTLGTVDDEGALIGHHGEVAHEDELLLDLAGLLVGETNVGQKRGLIGHVLLAALLDGVRGVAELMLAEGNLENMVLALDGAGFLERLTKALVLKTLKGFPLNRDKVGDIL